MKIDELESSSQNQLNLDEIEYAKEIIWRRNAPYFYQVLYTTELQWPSLTVEWRPDSELNPNRRSRNDPQYVTNIAYATTTSGQQPNCLVFGKVRIPNQEYLQKKYRQSIFINNIGPPNKNDCVKKNDNAIQSKIQIKYEVEHPGEINRVRYNPVMTHLIASRTSKGDILVIDEQKYMKGRSQLKPYLTLKGHQGEGFAVQWNKNNHMQIAAGSYNGKLSVWNTVHKTSQNCINPMSDFIFHKKQIQDVSWNNFHDSIFASCDDAGFTAFWDMRTSNKPIHTMQNHQGTIYSLQFSPLNEYLWATGGEDRIAKVWDVRNVTEPLFEWKTGEQPISNMRWSSDDKTSLWTVNGQLMTLWDVCDQKAKFVHGGHLKRVNEMAVHPNLSDVFASVDEDNAIHIFQPNKNYK